MTSTIHPLFGRLLDATGFKRWKGRLLLVVFLPDGSPGTIPVEATDVLGEVPVEVETTVLTVEGLRELKLLVAAIGAMRSPSGRRTRK